MEREPGFPLQTDQEREDDNPHFEDGFKEDIPTPLAKSNRKAKFPNTPEWQALKKKLNPPESKDHK